MVSKDLRWRTKSAEDPVAYELFVLLLWFLADPMDFHILSLLIFFKIAWRF